MAAIPDQSTASNAAEDLDVLDRLFDAIRDQEPLKVRQILLGGHPSLVNRFNGFRPETPQHLFDNKRFEYILTQDILGRDLDNEIVVADLCRQKPLHLACIIGDMETVKVLLEQEYIDLNLKNDRRETCFSLACRSANLHIAKLLLDNGFKMSPNMMDDANKRPLDYLVYRDDYPKWSDNFLRENQSEVLSDLTQKIMDKFHDERFNKRLLRSVVEKGNLPMFEAVLKGWWSKPDLKTLDERGWTLLGLAQAGGHTEMAERLRNRGANPNAQTEQSERMTTSELEMRSPNGSEAVHPGKESSLQGDEYSGIESQCWRWLSHDCQRKENLQRRAEEFTLEDLINNYGREDKPPTQGETLWCHLQENSVGI